MINKLINHPRNARPAFITERETMDNSIPYTPEYYTVITDDDYYPLPGEGDMTDLNDMTDHQFWLDAGDWLLPEDEAEAAELKRLVKNVVEWGDPNRMRLATPFHWQIWFNRCSDLGAFIQKCALKNGLTVDED